MRFRHLIEAVGLAATLGAATSAKAEQPSAPPSSPLESLTKAIEVNKNILENHNKIEGFNPNGLHKPPKDVVDGLSREIEIARDFALKLAVDPKIDKPEETKGYAGIEIKL